MAGLNTPTSTIDGATLSPRLFEQEQADIAEMESLAQQLEANGLQDDAQRLRADFARLTGLRRARDRAGFAFDDVSTGIGQAISGIRNDLQVLTERARGGAAIVGEGLGNVASDVAEDLANTRDTFIEAGQRVRQVLDPVGVAQVTLDDLGTGALGDTTGLTFSPSVNADLQQAQPMVPEGTLGNIGTTEGLGFGPANAPPTTQELLVQQGLALDSQIDQRNNAIIESILQQDRLRRNADLAASLQTVQSGIDPLQLGSAVLPIQAPTAAPATFNGLTPIVQAAAPQATVPSLLPALNRNAQNNLQLAAQEQRLTEADIQRLNRIRRQAAEAFVNGPAAEILSRPRNQ